MHLRARLTLVRLTFILIIPVLLLAGCSTRFAYKQLDLLVPWYVGDYVTLDRDQKRLLDVRLAERLSWHCSSQLGPYAALLRALETRLGADDALAAAELEQFLLHGEAFWHTLMVALTPDARVLLAALDAGQIDELAAAFAERNEEARAKFVDGTPDQLRTRQIERMEKRLRTWFGRLQPDQRERVAAWSAHLAPTTEQWLQNRMAWQRALLAALAQRSESGFEAKLAELLTSPELGWSASHRAGVAHNRALTLQLVADIYNGARPDQRKHLLSEIATWAGQFEQLACAAALAPTASAAPQ